MTSDDWKRVEELFDEALEKREEDRTQWLELECDDPLIRAEVIDMLAGHAMDGGVLEEEAQDFASDLILRGIEEEEAVHRKRVGSYKLVREIGAGGMGKVFLGVRDDGQFDQDVAVKLLRPGLVTEQINKRFLAERQILAGFRHPNIARLYDGGVLDDGTPYFIMEYVEGSTITEYCVENGLTLDRRLELFLQVCDAVAHAHQKLVVHRDLKPSNIMVTKAGRVKLLDFGIAKLLDSSDGSEQVAVTQTGLHLLTPEYASPEQINGELISTSSDVYQLGVILYEMLAEQRPYRFESRALSEITRVVLEQEPARPSTLFKKDSAVISAPQSPRRWMHRLRGDLDAITLTALRKDPSARYASVDQLSADVRRYKDGQPVQARERSVGYRARKFVRRYRWQVAVAFVIAVYAVTVTVQQASTARERDRAERYANFMTSLFASPDPFGDQAKTDQRGITVQEFLDQALLRLDQELAADPVVHADLLTTIGQVYSGLGSDDKAAIQFEQALSINRVLYGDESAETIQTMRLLASSTSDRQVADSMFQTQLKLAYEVDGGSGLVTGRSLIGYGHFLVGEGRLEDADSLLAEAIVIGTEHGDENPEFRADAAYYAGQVSGTLGELDRADSLLTEAVEIRRETYGGDHPATGTAMTALAYIAKNKGEYDRAERLQ
ncbi:MAG: protein kinase, partial [Rhodothermia bacterium]